MAQDHQRAVADLAEHCPSRVRASVRPQARYEAA